MPPLLDPPPQFVHLKYNVRYIGEVRIDYAFYRLYFALQAVHMT